jgi:predicted RNA-binding protein YlxR (DUF448 family)
VAPKTELVRLAFASGQSHGTRRRVVLDASATMPGRGAYICRARALPVAECLMSACERGGIARTLRSAVSIDPELIESVNS